MSKEKKYPLMTVVTATYKKFDHIYETIRSVYEQNYPSIEYIICDDGSANFPEKEINEYVKKIDNGRVELKIIRQPENIGTVRNLNSAYKFSKGDYVMNLSAGDVFFTRDVVTKVAKIFQEQNASLVVTSRMLYNGNYNPLYLIPHYEEREILKKLNTSKKQYKAFILNRFYDMASGSAMALSKEILEELGYYDERYVLWEDGPFIAKYLLKHKIYMAYEIISIWYEDGGVSAVKHPLLKKDIQNYDSDEHIRHIEILNSAEKKLLEYQIKLQYKNTKFERIPLFIRYFPQMLSTIKYKKERNSRISKDKKVIDHILKKYKNIIR